MKLPRLSQGFRARATSSNVSRPELFDAAVNKALSYALRLGLPLGNRDKLRTGLELWYLKTRFAYRIPLETVVETLRHIPSTETANYTWHGGRGGSWEQKNPQGGANAHPTNDKT